VINFRRSCATPRPAENAPSSACQELLVAWSDPESLRGNGVGVFRHLSKVTQFDKYILLAQGYSEIKELSFIIKACRFKPHDYIFKDKSNKLILYTEWFDEYGNSWMRRIQEYLDDLQNWNESFLLIVVGAVE
jgi:hypothetical protein